MYVWKQDIFSIKTWGYFDSGHSATFLRVHSQLWNWRVVFSYRSSTLLWSLGWLLVSYFWVLVELDLSHENSLWGRCLLIQQSSTLWHQVELQYQIYILARILVYSTLIYILRCGWDAMSSYHIYIRARLRAIVYKTVPLLLLFITWCIWDLRYHVPMLHLSSTLSQRL